MKYTKAFEVLNKIYMGWNVGNYLDAHDKTYQLGTYNPKSVKQVVNLWHNPVFNLRCIDNLKSIGINCLRLPVTFCNFINLKEGVLSISNEVLDHLKNIIGYAISKDFYVILDMHHDDQTWLNIASDKKHFKEVCKLYGGIWRIVAKELKDFDNHLIFEGMNEVIDRSNAEKPDWVGKKKFLFKNLNKLYELFIKAVRNYSLNNIERTLMISTYGAQIHEIALKNFKLPKDENIIVDVHYYSKHSGAEHFESRFSYVKEYFLKKNIPIIIGECGIKKAYMSDFSILSTYLGFAKNNNLKCVLWDNGSTRRVIDRETSELTYLELLNYLKSNQN